MSKQPELKRSNDYLGFHNWYQSFALRNFDLEDMELESTNSGPTAKLPILKLGEYEMWVIRIKQYFQIQDYALWEVIENGNSWVSIPQTTKENGTLVTKMSILVTAEEKINKKNDVKARNLLLMALPNEHQLPFSQYPDAKSMFASIEIIFGGNAATKKTQKTLLKQQYENFSATSAESLDSIFNRLQKIVSRLAILVVSMNKPEIKTMSIDDLYNNFKIVEKKLLLVKLLLDNTASVKKQLATLDKAVSLLLSLFVLENGGDKEFEQILAKVFTLPNQQFEELPFEEAILTFLRDLGHNEEIKMITDVNVNKLHQPWRSFVAVINKCLSDATNCRSELRRPITNAIGVGAILVREGYRDVNVNLEGRDSEMTDASRTIVQTTQVIEDTHVIITLVNPEGQQHSSSVSSGFILNMLNPSPDTGIDSLFNLNTKSTSLIDVPVTTFVEPPLLSVTTLLPPPTPLITHLQQTSVPTPPTVPSSSLQDLPNFGSLFGFDHRLKTLENNFSEFNQTNQFAAAVSLITGIVDVYLANKMHEAIKTAIHL
ncbi:hypothetical protein Tco_1121935 [Tanacetum coccineum]|uniref:Uncharacterized protein n=1 Tax=Tanacetum coccineum TaxID=301880 RepID=A0ABQ5IZ49_9ASTR